MMKSQDFRAGRVGVRGCTFGVELSNQGEGSVGLRMGANVERVVGEYTPRTHLLITTDHGLRGLSLRGCWCVW